VAAIVGVALEGWSWSGAALAVALYYARMFFLTAGYHRYFALSGYGTEADIHACEEAGFSAHLTKPVAFADLLATIRQFGA
jgi:hypothetical protein